LSASALRLPFALLVTPLIAATLLGKFSVPPLGSRGISLAVPLIILVALYGLLRGWFVIRPHRVIAYVALATLWLAVPLLTASPYSAASVALLLALHLPYLLAPAGRAHDPEKVLDYFLDLVLLIAAAGIAQFAAQFSLGAHWAFPIENLMPQALVVERFNMQIPLEWGSSTYKANGLVMLEPSFFSQLLAVAIVAELLRPLRWWRLALMILALVLSYSGTGLLVLALCLPLLMLGRLRAEIVFAAVLGAVVLAAFSDNLQLERIASRATEFTSSGSSGFERFVGGYHFFSQFLWDDPLRALLGFGPGSFSDFKPMARLPVSEMSLTKMVFEYGLLGGSAYFGFLMVCIWRSPAPALLKLAVFATLLLNGSLVAFTHAMALTLLVWTTPYRPT